MKIVKDWQKYRKITLKEETEVTTQKILDKLENFSDNTWIFFDTETMGFNPGQDQLTEIAAVAVRPYEWEREMGFIGEFNEKIKLNPDTLSRLHEPESPERKSWDKSQSRSYRPLSDPSALLSMTRYGEKGRKFISEQEALESFIEFVNSFDNPLLIAQNASFDMKMVSTRLSLYGKRMDRYPVLDTLQVMDEFLIPLLSTLRKRGDEDSKELLDKMFVKRGRKGFYSTSMGVVAKAYGISTDDWHNALADVKMMMDMLRAVYITLNIDSDVNIRPSYDKRLNRRRNFKKRRRE